MTTASQDSAPADLRIGVIGVGQMGADHVARITQRIKGARVSAVTDYFRDKAEEVSATAPGSRVVDTPEELIAAEEIGRASCRERV